MQESSGEEFYVRDGPNGTVVAVFQQIMSCFDRGEDLMGKKARVNVKND